MTQQKHHGLGGDSPHSDKDKDVFPIWQLERQVAEQLRRGVKTISGSVVAVSVGSSTFTYVRKIGDELIVKYVEGCVVVTASAKLAEGEAKVYSAAVHSICGRIDI